VELEVQVAVVAAGWLVGCDGVEVEVWR